MRMGIYFMGTKTMFLGGIFWKIRKYSISFWGTHEQANIFHGNKETGSYLLFKAQLSW